MRVGIHLAGLAPHEGGGHTFERELIAALIPQVPASPHDFIFFGDSEKPPEMVAKAGVRYVSVHRGRATQLPGRINLAVERLWRSWRYPGVPFDRREQDRSLRRLLARERVAIVWSLTPTFLNLDVPFITTVWDLQHRHQPFFPEVSSNGTWARREAHFSTLIRRATFVLTGTGVGAEEIVRTYDVPPGRVRVLPLPTPQFALEAQRVPGRTEPPADPYVLYPAQFWPHKNHIGLLHALKVLVEEQGEPVRAVFVGSDQGNLEFVRRRCSELGLTDLVEFRGFVPTSELIDLYRGAVALAYVSLFGPDNLPPLEAFALGCPVIAANVPGAAEQLGDAAHLIDARDEYAIADGISRIRRDRGFRDRLVAQGYRRAAEWTNAQYVESVLQTLDEFASVRRCWAEG